MPSRSLSSDVWPLSYLARFQLVRVPPILTAMLIIAKGYSIWLHADIRVDVKEPEDNTCLTLLRLDSYVIESCLSCSLAGINADAEYMVQVNFVCQRLVLVKQPNGQDIWVQETMLSPSFNFL